MAEVVDESAFWLPSEFLTDEDFFLMANHKPQSVLNLPPRNNGGFPLFRRSSVLNSPVESVESSTETESSDDPDEFIAELTHHLTQSDLRERATTKPHQHHPWESRGVLSTSPQSTLSGFTGWTNRRPGESRTPTNAPPQMRSPPAFEPTHDDALELMYAAAERLAKMRMISQAQIMNHQQAIRRGLLSADSSHMASYAPLEGRTPPVRYNLPQNNQFQQMKNQAKQAWLNQQQIPNRGGNSTVRGLHHQSSFPPLRAHQQSTHLNHHACNGGCGGAAAGPGMRVVFLGGSGQAGVKKQSTGTGVFLPRRIGNNSPTEPRKKQGCSTVLLPSRVVQALNLNIDDMNGPITNTQTQPCLASSNHEILVARRNAVFAQQQRRGLNGPMSHREAPSLPQEWTY